MSVLTDIAPRRVFSIFEQICSIPHGSGNTRALGEWCLSFAREKGLAASMDSVGNVLVAKAGSAGRQEEPPVLLQAHLDMVCEKLPEKDFDFLKDGIPLATDGQTVWAQGTTLGADNGIGIAMILSVLEDQTLSHPPLEAVLTVDEETGLEGACALDFSGLRSRRMINLDSEDEGVFTAGCAGGVRMDVTFPLQRIPNQMPAYAITVGGLRGGHSGIDIHKGRRNANRVLASLIRRLTQEGTVQIADFTGGALENVICRQAACVAVTELTEDVLRHEVQAVREELLAAGEKGATVTLKNAGIPETVWEEATARAVLTFLTEAPDGVQAMCEDLPDLVETSLNLGIVRTRKEALTASFALRSSVEQKKEQLMQKVQRLAGQLGATVASSGNYPGWEYRAQSPLRRCMVETFQAVYGRQPVVDVIHAGLECGLFCEKCPELDAVSMGPDMKHVHTPQERVSVASVQRVYEYLLQVLARL